MLIIAHRGASSDAPENTLAAFRLAWEQGADGVELDLRLSADRRLVVHHDADTRRTCGQRLRVAGTTSEKLATLDAGRWKAPRWTGERIPQLGGVLAEAPLGSCVMIEIKAGPEIVPVLADELGSLPADRLRLVVMAFDLGTVGAFKRAMPGLCCHLVVSSRRSGRWEETTR